MPRSSQFRAAPTIDVIRRYIVENGLQAGDRFPTDVTLSGKLGLGLSRLRHALRTLHQLGIVDRRRKAGTFLSRPDPSHLAEHISVHVDLGTYTPADIRRARAMLEHGIAAEAARNRTSRDLLAMKVALESMEAGEGDYETVNTADHAFHQAILAAANNPLAMVFSKVITAGFKRLSADLQVFTGEPYGVVLSEHRAIFENISKQKHQEAGEIMYHHIAYPRTTRVRSSSLRQPKRRNVA